MQRCMLKKKEVAAITPRASVGTHKTYIHIRIHYKYIECWLPFDFDLASAHCECRPSNDPYSVGSQAGKVLAHIGIVIRIERIQNDNSGIALLIHAHCDRIHGDDEKKMKEKASERVSEWMCANDACSNNGECSFFQMFHSWNERIIKYNNIICENAIDWIPIEL